MEQAGAGFVRRLTKGRRKVAAEPQMLFVSRYLRPMERTGTALDWWQRHCSAKRGFSRKRASETVVNPAPAGRAQAGGRTHENRHGHHQALQARRGPRRADRDRRAWNDRDRGQGLRAPEGTHRNLTRRRICSELLAENQDRSGGLSPREV